MSVLVTDPLAALRSEIEAVVARSDLEADEKIAKLRAWRQDLVDLLGLLDTYTGDQELVRESLDPAYKEQLLELRSDARIRDDLVRREIFTADEMDALGYLANDDLDKLDEEGLLEAWIEEAFGLEHVMFDPLKHPRGRGGKWTDVLGRALSPKTRHGRAVPLPRPPKPERPHAPSAPGPSPHLPGGGPEHAVDVGDDLDRAVRLLGEGQHVRLNQPRQVSVLLDKLGKAVEEARAKGKDAPVYDLCKVSVKGTNLFCHDSKGVPRVEMPQLKGTPQPGSKADALTKDKNGRVDLSEQFRQHLEGLGAKVTPRREGAAYLRPTQRELNGALVARLADQIEAGKRPERTLFVSRDNYILDGHHEWAAKVGVDLKDNKPGEISMPVDSVDMDIGSLLDEAHRFSADWGVGPQSVAAGSEQRPEPTPDEVAADLDKARDVGANDPAEKGDLAKEILGDNIDTRELHTRVVRGMGGTRVYTPERQKLHDSIIDMMLRQRREVEREDGTVEAHPDPVGDELKPPTGTPVALFMGGGTASGKTVALGLEETADAIPPNAVHIDPDEIKASLPEYVRLVQAGDRYASPATHEESSHLAYRLRAEAVKRGLNVVIDGTGDSEPGKFVGKIHDAKQAGYNVHVFYVNAPTDVAITRAVRRAQQTGRWVPEAEVRKQHKNVSARFEEVRAAVEDGTVSRLRMYQTETEPTLIAEGTGGSPLTIHDQGLYDRFVAKAHEGA